MYFRAQNYIQYFFCDVLQNWILTFCTVMFDDDTRWLNIKHLTISFSEIIRIFFVILQKWFSEDIEAKMKQNKSLDWQQQMLKCPLVFGWNFKYVKLSRILLAISFIGCCRVVYTEPISTIDASSSIPGKNEWNKYLYIYVWS